MATKQTRVVHRSSVNGEFVTQRFAQSHPNTTERQHVLVQQPKSPQPKKGK